MSDPAGSSYQSTLDPTAKACGNCRLWRAHSRNESGAWVGPCRIQPQRGLFPPEAPICSSFLSREAALPSALPETKSKQQGRVVPPAPPRIQRPVSTTPDHPFLDPLPAADVNLGELLDMTRDELKRVLHEVMEERERAVSLAPKWEGGTVVVKPADPALKAHEMPIDALLHKVVAVRNRLRVLEQKVNAHPKLTDAEKVELQQYVTGSYGSLTSFNFLFRDRSDGFTGSGGGD